ncbi:uncharacterized protein LOC131438897 [Malaya genurostris]|uniref:uncharacterized protein LOC131438897 n=1 Tax=Malaya genurostris TaxID=325434 RepID=UPI0026F3A0CA|nr:uncharacterized protein LOC131438897 [Malaya genurostris]
MSFCNGWYSVLIWLTGFCSICLLIYICTFKSYLKGIQGTISQLVFAIPQAVPNSKAVHNTTVFVIDVESNEDWHPEGYLKNPTLNLEAIVRSGHPKPIKTGPLISDSWSTMLIRDTKEECFTI